MRSQPATRNPQPVTRNSQLATPNTMNDHVHIPLDLRRHCIETETKRLYNRKVAQYFKHTGNHARLEAEIELLKSILETFDFGRLRSHYPALAGKSDCSVAIKYDKQKNLVIMIDNEPVKPLVR
jgi:hypothetical protein